MTLKRKIELPGYMEAETRTCVHGEGVQRMSVRM